MKTPIATLLERAANAPRPMHRYNGKYSRSSWAPLYPVVQQLIVNGYKLMPAVDWLIEQREIEPAKRRKAYRALREIHKRRKIIVMP